MFAIKKVGDAVGTKTIRVFIGAFNRKAAMVTNPAKFCFGKGFFNDALNIQFFLFNYGADINAALVAIRGIFKKRGD